MSLTSRTTTAYFDGLSLTLEGKNNFHAKEVTLPLEDRGLSKPKFRVHLSLTMRGHANFELCSQIFFAKTKRFGTPFKLDFLAQVEGLEP